MLQILRHANAVCFLIHPPHHYSPAHTRRYCAWPSRGALPPLPPPDVGHEAVVVSWDGRRDTGVIAPSGGGAPIEVPWYSLRHPARQRLERIESEFRVSPDMSTLVTRRKLLFLKPGKTVRFEISPTGMFWIVSGQGVFVSDRV